MLFRLSDSSICENFTYPNISDVKLTIEGVPDSVYSQGIPKSRFYDEPKRFFQMVDKDQFMTVEKFLKEKFALVIDLRSIQVNNKTGIGKKIVNPQNGMLLEIKKTATTSDRNCNIYIISDALVNFVSKDLQSIQY